jgi:hypothetical protein
VHELYIDYVDGLFAYTVGLHIVPPEEGRDVDVVLDDVCSIQDLALELVDSFYIVELQVELYQRFEHWDY